MKDRTLFYVDFSILEKNYSLFRKYSPHNRVLFMVKANAYGHGAVPIVHFCVTKLGITEFGAASLEEALELRESLSDLKFDIYVFSDVQLSLESRAELYLFKRIIPVISHLSDLRYALERQDFVHLPLCLKFNTGMNRLGLSIEETDQVVALLKSHGRQEIFHLMSHFSSANCGAERSRGRSKKITAQQLQSFRAIKEQFKKSGLKLEYTSMANSGAIEQGIALEETHVRPGLMLYGPSALIDGSKMSKMPKMPKVSKVSKKGVWAGQMISRLETYVIDVFGVSRGTPLGYGAVAASVDGQLAQLAIGYGDGLSTRFSGVQLALKGIEGRFEGRVNMDMIGFLSPLSKLKLRLHRGDRVCLWERDVNAFASLCRQSGLSPYEILCQISGRIPRIYLSS